MAALGTLHNSCELDGTPLRKRKRKFKDYEQEHQNEILPTAATTCFTNAAFSSTPKKILGKRRIVLKKNKENEQIFANVGLEVKSIAEVANHLAQTDKVPENPYEVLRKPPKKKRHTEKITCFENQALNLELPEKLFNPFEVVRDITLNKSSNCFSNAALNLKTQDGSVLCNPFEVQREVATHNLQNSQLKSENNPPEISSDMKKQKELCSPIPCKLRLEVPFIPRVGYRIDFNDISISQLTPSKLLAEKLVFSPVQKCKISLGSIEEETTMDIGKELDRYQLELENSINEAKLRKTGVLQEEMLVSPPNDYKIPQADIEKFKFMQKLSGIPEDVENEEVVENLEVGMMHVHKEQNAKKMNKLLADTNPFKNVLNKEYEKTDTVEEVELENLDELYGYSGDDQEDEESFDFKNPAAFVRAYTKPYSDCPKLTVSKESLESKKSEKSGKSDDNGKQSSTVKNVIRKSIRKLMPTHWNDQQQKIDTKDNSMEKPVYEKNNGFMNVIRKSLRRKPIKKLDEDNEDIVTKENEISIIDCAERRMKLKSDILQTEYVKIEDLTNEKKHSLRNSIRKSTRDVRKQFMKSVFHTKHEEYDFSK